MFDMSKIAAMMSGDNSTKKIYFDMRRCIIQESSSTQRVLPEELEKVLTEVIVEWPKLEEHKSQILKYYQFNVDEFISQRISSDLDMFDGIDSIVFDYPIKHIEMRMRNDGDVMSIYRSVQADGGRVTGQNMSEGVTAITSHYRKDGIDNEITFVCVGCELGLNPGDELPDIGLRLWTPIVLDNNKIYSQLIVDRNRRGIEIYGDVLIESVVPIVTCDVGEILIKGSGKLTLISTEDMQPCIGTRTATGLSWGRWSPIDASPARKIIIDGVEVVCQSKVDNFTLGKYGSSFVPEIELRNGGSLVCPEMNGTRVITQGAEATPGSSKLSGSVRYGIIPIDTT